MPEPKTCTGGCHCGRVRFEASSALTPVVACNCSICAKRGALWAFVKAPDFKLWQGAEALADYQFGARKLHHLFCSTCGIGSYSRGRDSAGQDTFAVNVRCLDGVDLDALTLTPFDGKSL
jgi:hypothetical protein